MNEVTTYKVERQGKANKSATSLSMHVCINSSAGSLLNACITRVVAFVCQQTLGDNSGIWTVGIPLMQSYVQHPYRNDLASELTHYMTISSVYMDMEIRQRVGKKMSLEKKRVVVVKGLLPAPFSKPSSKAGHFLPFLINRCTRGERR